MKPAYKKLSLKLLLLCICSVSCSKNENNDNPKIIHGTDYGFSVRGNGADSKITFTYKVFNKDNGKIYHSGKEENGDTYNAMLFPITIKELDSEQINIEIQITSTINGRVHCFFHMHNKEINKDFLYMLDWDQNPDAATPHTMNELKYNESLQIYEGSYPYKAPAKFWFSNANSTWEDYKN